MDGVWERISEKIKELPPTPSLKKRGGANIKTISPLDEKEGEQMSRRSVHWLRKRGST